MNDIKIHFIVDMDEECSSFAPSLGVGYLSSYIKKHVENVTTSMSLLSDDIMFDIEKYNPDIIGISSTSRYFEHLKEIALQIKRIFDKPIVWGGVHISIAPQELPVCADLGVIGEGEETLSELLCNFRKGQFTNIDSLKGITFKRNGDLIINPPRPFIESLDSVPYPDLDLLRVKWDRHHRAVMVTSRGCPFKCRFCASSKYWGRTRLHSPAYVVDEMKMLADRYHAREILIYDDFFTINKKRISEIANLIKNDPAFPKLKFECLSRLDVFDEILADHLKDIGVYRISFGIESGCQKTLDYLKNSTLKLEQIEKGIDIAKSRGFECVGSFIIGSPFESEEDIEETLSFIKRLRLDSVQITIATPFPGTELWEDGKKIGKITNDEWSNEYYTLFANSPEESLTDLLKDKRLLTQIDRRTFFDLAGKAESLANRINLSRKNLLKIAWKGFFAEPHRIPWKIAKGIKYLSSNLM